MGVSTLWGSRLWFSKDGIESVKKSVSEGVAPPLGSGWGISKIFFFGMILCFLREGERMTRKERIIPGPLVFRYPNGSIYPNFVGTNYLFLSNTSREGTLISMVFSIQFYLTESCHKHQKWRTLDM